MDKRNKFTPGPWFAFTGPGLKGGVNSSKGFRVAECTHVDAALIAASPEMFEALVECVFVDLNETLPKREERIYRLHKLIAKARGEIK
jgi:hypothetical protein